MVYQNITPRTLYQSCMPGPWGQTTGNDNDLIRACAWVEAENVYAVWKVVCDWFDALEDGSVQHRLPDPLWQPPEGKAPLTQEAADTLIEHLDDDFMLERTRFRGRLAPEFSRLEAPQRLAFAQAIWDVLKTRSQVIDEAKRRLDAGEELPPPIQNKGKA